MAVPPDGLISERALADVCRSARPARDDVGIVIEREHEELVRWIHQLEEELLDGAAGIDYALAEHAVAHVQQHAETDGHAFVRELRDRLQLAVLVDLERLPGQAQRETAVGIEHGGCERDHVDAGPQHALAALHFLRCRRAGHENGGDERKESEERAEPRRSHTVIVNPSALPRGQDRRGRFQKRNLPGRPGNQPAR